MKILDRYILRQLMGSVLLALGLFLFVLIAGNAIRDIVGLLAGGKIGIWGA